ncbi:septum formation inhibitor Maf [Acidithiobacillus sp. CV18-2]|uniref:dTTP/UTP pyrophosphatase n=1 Tax=Igneacidithiobacillus copahuensis TaxID=2724909 RepID=A0AAE3CIW7_9PROT|nr:nucleoside triphosphate pyrophosphatase [Igneacidithiobacillus copahuensis]MBU2754599.1 septum formation inhibitor Maf [Acidithiobacillus sp. CV18-3]MBU2757239.1 septum formation inhibitor Maf [Acidithiobacillus sp. BN09-2]MBU2776808.1 septum formation inhibitor Maf [Acidithiobacillus sp. CV18-2]MBU2796444.1 septum formation inhibitor Maf [Acidithiobacillus sp. VAN18-2]MBU2799462.1 septum formation inhibitor Maf [Acidithiobacillus sp. VAN18-4]UTV81028.1 Maf family nucleotide pyrophosphatas
MPQLILASASPRRRELLAQLGYTPELRPTSIDESRRNGEPPAQLVRRLAREKARAAVRSDENALVLGADTLVCLGDRVFGKPADAAEAQQNYALLGGRWHQVLTAVAITDGQRVWQTLSRNAVFLRPISPAEAHAYWVSGEPQDKAGGYAIQGLGAVFVRSLRGSYSGVMGLPLAETAALLSQLGLPPPHLQARHE